MTIRNDWKTSISTSILTMSDERLADMQNNGVEFMELTCCDYKECPEYPQTAKKMFSKAADYGVTIRSFHLPFCVEGGFVDPASADAAERKRFMDIQVPLLKAAADSGVEIAVIHPSGEPYEEETRAENLKYSIGTIAELNEIAKKSGIKLAVENLPRTCICRNCEEIKAYTENIPDIFYCFDSNHSLKDSNKDFIETMGERIVALHISDYDFINERHWFPGEGSNKWQEIIETLEKVGYSGSWNYEIDKAYTHPVKRFADNHSELLKGIIK